MEYLEVTFRIRCAPDEANDFVQSLLLEQTVETPLVVANRNEFVRDQMLGHVIDVRSAGENLADATIALPVVNAATDVAQFLNVLFGNASLHEAVSLLDFVAPPSILSAFEGPRFGIDGIRGRLGVPNRPLTCSALKPVGLSVEDLATLCSTLTLGGIDVIKDDHYLADQPFSAFEERVDACQRAVAEARTKGGSATIYCPNLSGTPDAVFAQATFAQETGVGAVMVAPMLIGLPTLIELRRRVDVPIMLHPSFAGSLRIRPDTMFGRIFRLYGGDAIIFANFGGRFSYAAEVCGHIAHRLRSEWQHLAPAFPVPAGGMTLERVPELIDFFGNDAMLLVGGSLLSAGDALLDRTRAFTGIVADYALAKQ